MLERTRREQHERARLRRDPAAVEPRSAPRLPTAQDRDAVAIADIKVSKRHRREMGNIEALAASIREIGFLMHPIVVRPDGRLIAGERRLRAVKLLGWTKIPATVIDLDAIVRGEFAENTHRKDFTLSEAVAVKRAMEPLERELAKQRMLTGKPSEKFSKGRALDKVAAVTGRHRTTLAKAEVVVDAAKADPDKFGKLLADMDRTGKANGPYRRLNIIKQAEAIRAAPPPLPGRGPYRVIAADAPWPTWKRDYPTMSVAEICALDAGSIAADDSVLWLWTINSYMREAHDVLAAWGFKYQTTLTWAKDRAGVGNYLWGQTEHCLLATRGKPIITLSNQSTLLVAPVRGPSQKPTEFYDLVETLCPAPRYAELFSRYRHNERWDCHGDQAPQLEAAE
jgi:N6-adenosine-specific RNA methylase IME4